MNIEGLRCAGCGRAYAPDLRFEPCGTCGDPLEVVLDPGKSLEHLPRIARDGARGSIWRFRPLLPVPDGAEPVTLGEGGTPLTTSRRIDAWAGAPVILKLEAANPTWSFKDRLNSLNATLARACGFKGIVASSTGNHGASAAAFAAAAGLRSVVFVPEETPDVIGRMIASYGGETRRTPWDERSKAMTGMIAEGRGIWFPSKSSLPAPFSNPFGLEAYKTIAYEIAFALKDKLPGVVLVPVGSGDDIFGIFKGFRDLRDVGLIPAIPRLVSCEIEGASPVSDALAREADRVVAAPRIKGALAVSISEGVASTHALRAVRESGGLAGVADEVETVAAARELARSGLCAESSSCVAVAVLRRLVREGALSPDEAALVVLTSSGLKWPDQIVVSDPDRPRASKSG